MTGYRPDLEFLASLGIRLDPESQKPRINPETFESDRPGIFLAGVIVAGMHTNEIFIENGRFHGKQIADQRSPDVSSAMTRRDFAKLASRSRGQSGLRGHRLQIQRSHDRRSNLQLPHSSFARRLHCRHEGDRPWLRRTLGQPDPAEGSLRRSQPGVPIHPWTKSAASAKSLTTRESISTLSTTAFVTNSPTSRSSRVF